MATFSVVVKTSDKKKDGTYNVKIRITHNRKSRYKSTPFFIPVSDVSKTGKMKNQYVIDKVNEEIKILRQKNNELGFSIADLDVDSVISLLERKNNNIDFVAFARRKAESIMNEKGRESTGKRYIYVLNTFIRFVGRDVIPFEMMKKSLILQYQQYLKKHRNQSTADSYIELLNTIYRMAKRELNDKEAGIEIVKYDCFDFYKRTKINRNPRAFESPEEMQRVIDCHYTGRWAFDFTKDMFVLSFITFGTNPSDLIRLKKKDLKDGVLTYTRKKVENRLGDDAEIQIKLHKVAKIIIDKYDDGDDFLIGFCGHSRRAAAVSRMDKIFQSAGIDTKYVFYSARHSMASFARNICGVDFMTVNDMLNHSVPQSLSTTDTYIRHDYTHIWEANEKLLSLFDWTFYLNQEGKHY